ncbi:uncharacterized protein LOC141614496 [Silene latifolia]|uniref:uncharacterized protein LOC141614496 n=1 Tax=Silene latifolia TaxID=37657 RepID=UPI003D774A3A
MGLGKAIWEHRNKVTFDNISVEPELVVRRARDVINEEVGDSKGVARGTTAAGRSKGGDREEGGWKVARPGYVKINIDAGAKEGEGVTMGVVCRDSNGDVMWGVSTGREQQWEVPVAEACAVLDGLEEAVQRGIQNVEIESDCLQVIEVLKDRKTGRSGFAHLIEDILDCSTKFQSVIWSHVSRNNNCVAHALAHCFPCVSGKVVWDDDLPSSANSAVRFDKLLIE